MQPISLRVCSWQAWPTDLVLEQPEALPLSLRRRITPIGRHALGTAWGIPDTARARLILSSRHGEFSRTLSLMEAVVEGGGVSPADFTLSVHHALIGLLSIVQHNHRGHIAVAAGHESFCYGLLEAAVCLKEKPDEPVVLIHFDEPLPGPFAPFNEEGDKPIALALLLKSAGEGEALQLQMTPQINAKASISHAQTFLDFLRDKAHEAVSFSDERTWQWTRDALA